MPQSKPLAKSYSNNPSVHPPKSVYQQLGKSPLLGWRDFIEILLIAQKQKEVSLYDMILHRGYNWRQRTVAIPQHEKENLSRYVFA